MKTLDRPKESTASGTPLGPYPGDKNMSGVKLNIPFPLIEFDPPVYNCKRAPFALKDVDGNLDKEFWQNADFTEAFRDIEGPSMPSPRYETKAKMLWDDDNLYIGAILYGDEIWANQTEHDCVIFYDNDFEIFIDPDSDTQEYIEYEMNALGTYWDLLLTKAYRDLGSPINSLEVKGIKNGVKIAGKLNVPDPENKFWSVEVVIPFETIAECDISRKAPMAGDFYRMNFSRVQWKVDKSGSKYSKILSKETGKPLPEDNWVWSPTGVINIHYPELWGYVFFCESDETYKIPETEKIKWELRKVYYAEHAYFDENGVYTADKDNISEIFSRYLDSSSMNEICLDEYKLTATDSFFEAAAYTRDKTSLVCLSSDGKTTVKGGTIMTKS